MSAKSKKSWVRRARRAGEAAVRPRVGERRKGTLTKRGEAEGEREAAGAEGAGEQERIDFCKIVELSSILCYCLF